MRDYLIFEAKNEEGIRIRNFTGGREVRENFLLEGILCDPASFDLECRRTNELYAENIPEDPVLMHHYILGYSAKDRGCGLTARKAQAMARELAQKVFPGYQMILCTHTDRRDARDSLHTHLIVNSVRAEEVGREAFAEKESDRRRGHRHRQTHEFQRYMRREFDRICSREGLTLDESEYHLPDIFMTEGEYEAVRRSQAKLDRENKQKVLEGGIPEKVLTVSEMQYFRNSLDAVAGYAWDEQEFKRDLQEGYGIEIEERKDRWVFHNLRSGFWAGMWDIGRRYGRDRIQAHLTENRNKGIPAGFGIPRYSEQQMQDLKVVQVVCRMETEWKLVEELRREIFPENMMTQTLPADLTEEEIRLARHGAEWILLAEKSESSSLSDLEFQPEFCVRNIELLTREWEQVFDEMNAIEDREEGILWAHGENAPELVALREEKREKQERLHEIDSKIQKRRDEIKVLNKELPQIRRFLGVPEPEVEKPAPKKRRSYDMER